MMPQSVNERVNAYNCNLLLFNMLKLNPKMHKQMNSPPPPPPPTLGTLTFIVDPTVLVGVRQFQHLVQLVFRHILANHVHRRFELVTCYVTVAVAVEYPVPDGFNFNYYSSIEEVFFR